MHGLVFEKNDTDAALWYATSGQAQGCFWRTQVPIPDEVWEQVSRFEDTMNASRTLAKTNFGGACDGCFKECKKGKVPKKALINETWFGTVTNELRDLTSVEMSMISIYNSITMLTMLPSGGSVV